jgi:hypothetical protein
MLWESAQQYLLKTEGGTRDEAYFIDEMQNGE